MTTAQPWSDALAKFEAPFDLDDDGNKMMIPYYLFWRPGRVYRNGKIVEEYELTCLHVIGSHRHPEKIRHYIKKRGWKLVGHWLPPGDDSYRETREEIELLSGARDERVRELETERETLLAKLKEAEARKAVK